MKTTNRAYAILLSVLFSCIISVVFLNDALHFYTVPEISKTENRRLARRPEFDIKKLDPYPRLYNDYFNDHFPYRKELSLANTLISWFILQQSPLPDEVAIGRNGWLYFCRKESEVYKGQLTLSDWQIRQLVKDLHNRTVDYRRRGIRFYVAFPPMKPEIYPEFLPLDFMRAYGGTLTDKVVEAIRQDTVIPFVDLKEPLMKAKSKERVYYMTDNHWNWLGAYWGYQAIMERVKKDFPAMKPLTRDDFAVHVTKNPPGNLAVMLGLTNFMTETEYNPAIRNRKAQPVAFRHTKPAWAAQIPNYEDVRTTGNSSLPSAVVIHDSFTDAMMPFFDETFNTSTYIFDGWQYRRNDAIVDEVKPDIVMLIIFEPHIAHLVGKW